MNFWKVLCQLIFNVIFAFIYHFYIIIPFTRTASILQIFADFMN